MNKFELIYLNRKNNIKKKYLRLLLVEIEFLEREKYLKIKV